MGRWRYATNTCCSYSQIHFALPLCLSPENHWWIRHAFGRLGWSRYVFILRLVRFYGNRCGSVRIKYWVPKWADTDTLSIRSGWWELTLFNSQNRRFHHFTFYHEGQFSKHGRVRHYFQPSRNDLVPFQFVVIVFKNCSILSKIALHWMQFTNSESVFSFQRALNR